MINFFKIEQMYKDIGLKVLGYKEVDEESHYFYVIDFEYLVDNEFYIQHFIKIPVTENIVKALINKINWIKKEYYA